MYKKWLDEIRREIQSTCVHIQLENLEETSKRMRAFASILEGIHTLHTLDDDTEVFFADEQEVKDIQDDANQIYVGQFERELIGGRIGSAKIFVPESIVRRLSIEEGDWVRAKGNKTILLKNGSMRTLYDYVPLEKAEKIPETDRVQIEFQRVEYDDMDEVYYLQPTEDDFQGERVVISEKDRRNLYIEEDDLVDYAYFKSDPFEGRLIWKHKRD